MFTNNAVEWDNSYNLNIKSLDAQHKKLFEIVNRLYTLNEHSSKEEIRGILYEFSDYMRTHFKDEEQFMDSISYPGFQEHKKIHENIIEHLNDLIRTPAKIGIIKTKMRVLAKHTLIDHITHEDTKIKLFIKIII